MEQDKAVEDGGDKATKGEERPAPTNVIAALARVMEELPGIGKTDHSEQGYNYRGIESITRHAQQLFGRYGVVFVPRILERKTIELTVNNRPWTEEQLTIVYRVYGPGGMDDCIEVGPLLGLGRDNSDKGANKAMTQAFKYALLQTLCVGDGKDDADKGEAAVADERAAPPDPAKAARQAIADRLRAMSPEARAQVRAWCNADERKFGNVPARWTDEQLAAVEEYLDAQAVVEDSGAGDGEAPAAAADGELPLDAGADASAGDAVEEGPQEGPPAWLDPDPAVRNFDPDDGAVMQHTSEEELQAVVDEVKALDASVVDRRLREQKIKTDGNVDKRRLRLTLAILRQRRAEEHAARQA